MASSQNRCVFVGNIPYDATEEQLIQICEEVGPVVSFRLVIDRETGKPKGYGFCEYKDEETALSARRNLQGYDINGRQLRVDFAENDKNADKNREQGRGGPGMVANADNRKPVGPPAVLGDASLNQPIGLSVAMGAASLMAGALGGIQTIKSNLNDLQSQPVLGTDPLTLHLAKMSRNQLNEILSEIKTMATQNKEQARQLLVAIPHLPKALLQVHIMLGIVTPQMLQVPNIRQQASGPFLQQQTLPLPGLPPLPHNKVPFGNENQLPATSLVHNQHPSFSQPRIQLPQLPPAATPQGPPQPLPLQSGASAFPQLIRSFGPQSMKQQLHHPHHHPSLIASAAPNLGLINGQMVPPHPGLQPSLMNRPTLPPNHGFQPSSSGVPDDVNQDSNRPPQLNNNSPWIPSRLGNESEDPINRPSKLIKLDDSRSANTRLPPPSQAFVGTSENPPPKTESASKQAPQLQLPPELESNLLEQLLSLTPEQLSSLPPDQQQQVIQLQQMLRQQG